MIETVDRIVTANPQLLKDLPLEDVLRVHPLIDPRALKWVVARKVQPIKAKALAAIIADNSVSNKVLLATLEGSQMLRANSYVCWGVDNDVWQQDEKNLHAKYDAGHLDPDGWLHMTPKLGADGRPEAIACACVTQEAVDESDIQVGPANGFSIAHNKWGDERVIEGKQVFLHYGVVNDWIACGLKAPGEPSWTDIYRIMLKYFKATYKLDSPVLTIPFGKPKL